MTKRALVILVVAVLAIGGAAAAIASSIGGSSDPEVHTLPGGQTHTGELPESSTGPSGESGNTGMPSQEGGGHDSGMQGGDTGK